MRKNFKLLGAVAVAGLVATTGSAFTATSTIDAGDAAINVGSVSQSISGATVLDVSHAYTAGTDTTTSVTLKIDQWIDTTAGVVKVGINGGTPVDCAAATIVNGGTTTTGGADEGTDDHSTVACNVNTANVTSLQFVVNG